jgi:hypothetical protein
MQKVSNGQGNPWQLLGSAVSTQRIGAAAEGGIGLGVEERDAELGENEEEFIFGFIAEMSIIRRYELVEIKYLRE